jgi:energy-coupling factor transporter ATP-binding protein EcfA2
MPDDGFTIVEGDQPPKVVPFDKNRRKRTSAGGGKSKPERNGESTRAASRDNVRDQCIEAVMDLQPVFWRDPRGDAFVTLPKDGRLERYPVRSRDFRNIVRLTFGDRYPVESEVAGRAPRPGSIPDQALNEAIGTFEAMALRGRVRDPRPRLCRDQGVVWLDLCADDWKAVRIDGEGWQVCDKADVPLIRPQGMMPLPEPQRIEGDTGLTTLATLLNLPSGADGTASGALRLTVAWLVACLFPEGPFPVLAVDGEQGSGKTTTAKMLRRLVDPNYADARAAPREERDLLLSARNGRIVSLDNLSGLDAAMADAICRIATGGGFGERAYYTNGEEHIVLVQNPILLNGIPSLLARGDLADRAIAITLPPIPDDRRKPEVEVWRDFEAARPGLLAMLLDGLVCALQRLPNLHVERLPRMADFARLAVAMAPAFGWTEADMLGALEENRSAAVAGVIESDGVAVAVQAITEDKGRWTCTASELLAAINERTPLDRQRQRDWPKDATRLSQKLRRVAPALRRVGIEVILPASGGRSGRMITLEKRGLTEAAAAPEDQAPGVTWQGEI